MSDFVWKTGVNILLLFAIAAVLLGVIFYDGLYHMVHNWDREEYSHGYLLPLVSAYFVWQKRNDLAQVEFKSSWVGLLFFVIGLLGFLVGELSTLYTVIQYSFLVSLGGLLLAVMGWPAFRIIMVPYFILFFTVPLPNFLYNNLSAYLQLISSQLGVWVIRLFDISVYLEGNVIDLGEFKLQVVEACNGLRYLFPLMSLGFIAAYLYRDSMWKKIVLFLSTIPITVLMNSFRIGVIGVMVEYWGQEMAEGFLHDFEGWIIFMACTAVLVVEMWLLSLIGKKRVPFSEVFVLDAPTEIEESVVRKVRPVPAALYVSMALMLAMALATQVLPERDEVIPDRVSFSGFPMDVGEWSGRQDRLEEIYLRALKLSDYIIADYSKKDNRQVNFYVAYYESQRKGVSVHSPRSCIPGGGWQIVELNKKAIDGVDVAGSQLYVNRTVIQLGTVKQLVYYWFQQRGRVITNEYLVKWFLFWDSLTRQRSDGALVRLTTLVPEGQDIADADRLLQGFARDVSVELNRYIPE